MHLVLIIVSNPSKSEAKMKLGTVRGGSGAKVTPSPPSQGLTGGVLRRRRGGVLGPDACSDRAPPPPLPARDPVRVLLALVIELLLGDLGPRSDSNRTTEKG